MTINKVEAIRKFFSTPERPVTNAEIMELAKADREGYRKLAQDAAVALSETLEA